MAGSDREISGTTTVIDTVREYKREAREARRNRDKLNRRNEQAFFAEQDWSDKIEGQSTEFLPLTSETVEQLAAFVKRGLTEFGNWFSVEAKTSPISPESIRNLLKCFLDNLADGSTFDLKVSDGTKVAALKSYMIFKIHGKEIERRTNFKVEGDEVVKDNDFVWKPQIDLIRNEDYYKDPTGRDLYKIQHVERDMHDVIALGKRGFYNNNAVEELLNDTPPEEQEEVRNPRERQTSRGEFQAKARNRIQIDECWGTLLDENGKVWKENQVVVVGNDKHILRGPIDYPFWHGRDPFVEIPLLRVPHTIHHRALYDDAVPLNLAINELFNLMLDGGIANVWGVRQLRTGLLDDPSEVADGIPQGATLSIREDAPPNAKVLEQVTEGQVPTESGQMFSVLQNQFNSAALTNDIRSGNIPTKQVRATEVAAAQQSAATVMDSLTRDMEHGVEEVLEKLWLTILQNADDLVEFDVASALSPREQLTLARMSPAERFVALGQDCLFKVNGISNTLSKARDFQRLLAFVQSMATNPVTAPVLLRKYDPNKILEVGFKSINLDPKDIEREEGGENDLQQDIQIAGLLGLNGGSPSGVNIPGEPGIQSEVNQGAGPTDGGVDSA